MHKPGRALLLNNKPAYCYFAPVKSPAQFLRPDDFIQCALVFLATPGIVVLSNVWKHWSLLHGCRAVISEWIVNDLHTARNTNVNHIWEKASKL